MKASMYGILAAILVCGMSCQSNKKIDARIAAHPKTFCNPLNLSYRFMKIPEGAGIREAADPVVVPFHGKYWLFASKSSGYWYSSDFNTWEYVFIPDSMLPIEDYAPGLFVHEDFLYYVGSTRGEAMLYRSAHPESGEWEEVKRIGANWDPAFYVEGDSLYLYYGSSPSDPIQGQCFNIHTLEAQGEPIACLNSDTKAHGWERPGEKNELERRPYIEGAWMTEHDGKYYLQYAAPGTEWDTYADGAYVSAHPLGPFTYLPNSPVAYKPTGFIGGAGHGCLFEVGPSYWKAATNAISVRHMFERRVSFYPAGFDADGFPYTDTAWGDYPQYLPGTAEAGERPGWMLLSRNKPVAVSSALADYPATYLTDEKIRTAWVAQGNQDEWVIIDLENESDIAAIQVNYDEYGATGQGRQPGLYQSYVLYASHDGETWYVIADKQNKRTDRPHDYIEFETPFAARYIKWENKEYTVSGNVSLRELRIFGHGRGKQPASPPAFTVAAHPHDACHATLAWEPSEGAEGYMIRAGIAPDKLYHTFQVTDSTRFELTGLNAGITYYFMIDAYNANGITPGVEIKRLK